METAVLICGMPTSGNKLLSTFLEYNGVTENQIIHFGRGMEHYVEKWSGNHSIKALLPIRDPDIHWKAYKEKEKETKEDLHYAHFAPTLRKLATFQIPVYVVHYEDLVEAPNMEGANILHFLDVDTYIGWPVAVYNANAKYTGKKDPLDTEENKVKTSSEAIRVQISGTATRAAGHPLGSSRSREHHVEN